MLKKAGIMLVLLGSVFIIVTGYFLVRIIESPIVGANSSSPIQIDIDPRGATSVGDSLLGSLPEDIEAGLAIDVLTRTAFWAKSPDKPCLIASLTKLMVVLIAMEKINNGLLSLDDTVTVTPEASKIGGAQVYLKEGERFPLCELLKAMLVYSANDAAYLVGQHIGGSEEKFVELMNERANQMGLKATRFWNTTGLPPPGDDEHNVSSCIDMALLSLEVIKYPKVKEWAQIKVDYFRGGEFELLSWNTLLRHCPFVDGLKTGYYAKAGWNIVATSLYGERKVMVIILGAKTRWARDRIARLLIEYYLNK